MSRSGGSTGEPKFSIYDGHDWDALVSHAARIFSSMGIQPGDRVANLMLTGDLYGSFVSFDHVNARLEPRILLLPGVGIRRCLSRRGGISK